MAKWQRFSLGIVLTIVVAGLWGIIATVIGSPIMVVSLGAVVIGAAMIIWIHGKNSN